MSDYTIRRGDSLSEIARHHHVSLARLTQANPQIANPNLIQPGQVIHIPSGSVTHQSQLTLRWPRRTYGARFTPESLRVSTPPLIAGFGTPLLHLPVPLGSLPRLTFSYADMARMMALHPPAGMGVHFFGGDEGSHHDFFTPLVLPPRAPDPPDQVTHDFGTQITGNGGNQLAFEIYAAFVLHQSAFHSGRFDLLNQPTATITLGVGIDPTSWGSPQSYLAMSASITLLNAVLAYRGGQPFIEVGLGQLGLGLPGDGTVALQTGGGAEIHLSRRMSILLAGGGTFTYTGTGISATPMFNGGIVFHGD